MTDLKLNRRQFRQLQREWYKKVKATGFKDLEDANNQFKYPGQFAGKLAFDYVDDPVRWESRETYFRLTVDYVNKHKFNDPCHREVFQRHSVGGDRREIWLELKERYPHLTIRKVRGIVDMHAERMLQGPIKARAIQVDIDALKKERSDLITLSRREVGQWFFSPLKLKAVYAGMRVAFTHMRLNVSRVKKIERAIKRLEKRQARFSW